MNEKSKARMEEQHQRIKDDLSALFNLPVYQDDLAEDEYPTDHNYILIVYGSFNKTNTTRALTQEIYVVYVSENNPNVEIETLDLITTMVNIRGINFHRTVKDRLQKDDTDDFIDQVTCIFNRRVVIECKIPN